MITELIHKKLGTFTLSISLPVTDRFSNFIHWHTLWTICNKTIIIYPTASYKCISTLPCEIKLKYKCIMIITNKHSKENEKRTLQINLVVNDLYDNRLCRSNMVYYHTDHLPQCWSEVVFHIPKCLFIFTFIFHEVV